MFRPAFNIPNPMLYFGMIVYEGGALGFFAVQITDSSVIVFSEIECALIQRVGGINIERKFENDGGRNFNRGCAIGQQKPLEPLVVRVFSQLVDAKSEGVQKFVPDYAKLVDGETTSIHETADGAMQEIDLVGVDGVGGRDRFGEEDGELGDGFGADLKHCELLLRFLDEIGGDFAFFGDINDGGGFRVFVEGKLGIRQFGIRVREFPRRVEKLILEEDMLFAFANGEAWHCERDAKCGRRVIEAAGFAVDAFNLLPIFLFDETGLEVVFFGR